jgi:hypothetical protein
MPSMQSVPLGTHPATYAFLVTYLGEAPKRLRAELHKFKSDG